MEKGTILIVDDNKGVLASLELLLETEFSEIKTAHHPNQIISIINTSPIDVIILDMNFSAGINNGNEGLYWLKRIREIAPANEVSNYWTFFIIFCNAFIYHNGDLTLECVFSPCCQRSNIFLGSFWFYSVYNLDVIPSKNWTISL